MTDIAGLHVLFVAGFGPIVRDPQASKSFYLDTLQLPLEAMPHDPAYPHGDKIDGVRHFALWPLASAAESCFGTVNIGEPAEVRSEATPACARVHNLAGLSHRACS